MVACQETEVIKCTTVDEKQSVEKKCDFSFSVAGNTRMSKLGFTNYVLGNWLQQM
jgi:hypothetical protein